MDIGWTEDHLARLDDIAAEDHSYIATATDRARRGNIWVLVVFKLPWCAGQAADAVSAYTQVKMEDAPSLSEKN